MDLKSLEVDRFIRQYDPLIHKTLSRLHINQNHRDYDDFAQELRLKLLDLQADFDGDVFDEDKRRFAAYGGKGLYWHGLNLFKNKAFSGETPAEDITFETHPSFAIDLDETSNLAIQQFFEKAKARLTDQEYLVFLLLSEDQYTMQEIGDYLEVSRTTVYQWKQQITEKLTAIKDCLKL